MGTTQGQEGYGFAQTRGSRAEMANACLNNHYQGRGGGLSFTTYQLRTGRGNAARGWWGRPRVPQRCLWPLGPCVAGCTGRHIDGAALDAEAA